MTGCYSIASETPKSPSLHGRQQAAGSRQAGNVKSLIQQAVIQPAGKCRLSNDSVVVIVYEEKRREEQAYEYSEIRKARRQEGW